MCKISPGNVDIFLNLAFMQWKMVVYDVIVATAPKQIASDCLH